MKHQPMPTVASSTPPMAGPVSSPICMPNDDSALAAAIWSWRTVRGSSASFDGRWSAPAAASSAPTT